MEPEIRRIRPGDAAGLASFYNRLSARTIRTFRPLGEHTDRLVCEGIVADNEVQRKVDLVAVEHGQVVGWGFVWDIEPGHTPSFGLGVADDYQGRGLGSLLMRATLKAAHDLELSEIALTVVQDNLVAWRLYEKNGFVRCGEFIGQDGLPYYRMSLSLDHAGC